MLIDITSKVLDVTPAIQARVTSRFEKLERLQVPLITPHVVIHKEGLVFTVEATCGIPNDTLFAQAEHEDLHAAINALGQKLERQLIKCAARPQAHRAQRSGKEQCRMGTLVEAI